MPSIISINDRMWTVAAPWAWLKERLEETLRTSKGEEHSYDEDSDSFKFISNLVGPQNIFPVWSSMLRTIWNNVSWNVFDAVLHSFNFGALARQVGGRTFVVRSYVYWIAWKRCARGKVQFMAFQIAQHEVAARTTRNESSHRLNALKNASWKTWRNKTSDPATHDANLWDLVTLVWNGAVGICNACPKRLGFHPCTGPLIVLKLAHEGSISPVAASQRTFALNIHRTYVINCFNMF